MQCVFSARCSESDGEPIFYEEARFGKMFRWQKMQVEPCTTVFPSVIHLNNVQSLLLHIELIPQLLSCERLGASDKLKDSQRISNFVKLRHSVQALIAFNEGFDRCFGPISEACCQGDGKKGARGSA